jgi:colanic acid biosynthesis glycosyl transferase WcaI
VRIVIVSQHFHPEPFRITDLATWLSERGHEVRVLTGQPNYPSGRLYPGYGWIRPVRENLGSVAIHRVPIIPRGRGGALGLGLNFLSFLFTGSLLAPAMRLGAPEAILCFLPSPVTAAIPAILLRQLKRAPLALWVQDLWPESVSAVGMLRSGHLLKAIDQLVNFIYRRADAIWISSPAFEPAVSRYGVPCSRIVYVPNTTEDFYRVPAADGVPGRRRDGFSIVYAGNMGEAQGFDVVLDAVARIPASHQIQWTFVGDGRRRSWLIEQVARRKLAQVSICDRVPPERIPELLADSDSLLVTLRPHPVFALSIPSKLQSALASAKPVLAVLAGAGAAIVEQAGAGIVVSPGDAAGLAQAALDLAALPATRRREMGDSGRAYYLSQFDRERVYRRIEEELQGLCRRGKAIRTRRASLRAV